MSLAKGYLKSKPNRLMAFGCLSLSIAIALRAFVHPGEQIERILLDMLIGCLLGLFLGLVGFGIQGLYTCGADHN